MGRPRDIWHDGVVATHVALLRGINVGGRKKVAMADLRQVTESLGHSGVSTYIQSGNVLFTTEERETTALSRDLERAIAERLGVECRVVVLSREELEQAIRGNPYPGEQNPKLVHLLFLGAEPGPELARQVTDAQQRAKQKGSRDTVQLAGRVLYLHTPDGYQRSELAALLARLGGGQHEGGWTARNWATATKLLALCRDGP